MTTQTYQENLLAQAELVKYNDRTFDNFLKLLKLSEKQFNKAIEDYPVRSFNKNIEIKQSVISGVGCYSTIDHNKEDVVGVVLVDDIKTKLGRYTNHCKDPNVFLKNNKFIALKKISKNTEIKVDYFENLITLLK